MEADTVCRKAIRTIESHTQSGNRTLDMQSVQRRGSDGHFEPYQDIEKETVQVDAATVRTITRTFGRDADGAKTLVEVIEEEKHTLAGGDSNVVRATSDPDANGNLQLVQRRIEETKRTSKDVEETKTTVMLPSVDGGLVPAVKVQERREQGANGTVESQQTTLLPDGAGNWQVGEIRRTTTRLPARPPKPCSPSLESLLRPCLRWESSVSGFLAIPTLAGSAAYAFAETLGWRQGLEKKLKQARAFYALIFLSTALDVGLDFVGITSVKALYWTAVINGLLVPFLVVAILVTASDDKLMQGQPSCSVDSVSRLGRESVGLDCFADSCRQPSKLAGWLWR
ncbi:MAG: divalent metal cation transporter [Terriglobales bacterium]